MTKNWKYILLMAIAFPSAAAVAQNADAGRTAVELERYQEAKSIYKSRLNDKNAEDAYFALGDIYLRTGKTDSAAYYFNQALAKDSKSAINMVGLGKLELAKGNKAAAEKHFEQALKRSKSKDPYVLTMIAEAYVQSDEKDMTKAIEYAQKALERDNYKNPMAFVVLGDAYQKQKEYGKAMTNYEQAIGVDSNYATAHFKLGQLNTSSRIYNTAEEEFKKVIAINPNYAPAYHDLGELYFYMGKYDEAVSTFKKYLDLAEKTPETRAKYAAFLYKTKDFKGTLAEAEEVLKTDPNNPTMNRLRAYAYFELNQPEQALKAMETYFTKVDTSKILAKDYEYYGKILSKNKQNAKAIENMEKALEMDGKLVEPATEAAKKDLVARYADLANLYATEQQFDKALEVYDRKRANVEESPEDFYYIGQINMMAGDYAKADSAYANITKAGPTYPYGHLWRAYANASLDPESEQGLAKPHFEEFIKLAESDSVKFKNELVQAYSYLAYYYLVKNENDNSIKYWKQVLALDPENENAKIALKQLEKTPAKGKKK
ncbi:tetratricopeptide repeat protein [Botryobacter ruber]|uniref:tetratricopeptide repeat protein n=1 Tax=Botryobacter ruber TaxID=2171629 RepID=UPI000E0B87A2|nr:tetratricopeptide repeat protein [Botryobacter ruber]